MKTFGYARTLAIVLCTALPALCANHIARADEPAKPMALRAVMQQLDEDMQAVTSAIAREDWIKVGELAPQIGSHQQPPLREKTRILAWLGTHAGEFRGFDRQTHKAAQTMAAAAAQNDGEAVIAAFAKVQQSCLACHTNYRKSFQQHFYNQR